MELLKYLWRNSVPGDIAKRMTGKVHSEFFGNISSKGNLSQVSIEVNTGYKDILRWMITIRHPLIGLQ
ncbi:hypothetical protein SAMN04487911_1115 [Arenibacter nanhaiticus]|uniref:Uncharacterized protein n=1 Tax=Arenibacter nanhaiticus TaxID=558155 RepID=A0A1M6GGB8_9FLAO|nr:hypothetical protein SAMN04487911_1115 [Arenibacter nanhaiticus]